MADQKKFESKEFTDEELVSACTETVGGHPSQKSLWAQAELNHRLMESIRSLDKSTSHYSRGLFAMTVVLFVVAFLQLAIIIFAPFSDTWVRIAVFIGAVAIVFYVFWLFMTEAER